MLMNEITDDGQMEEMITILDATVWNIWQNNGDFRTFQDFYIIFEILHLQNKSKSHFSGQKRAETS